jgi:hypothetical protein
MVTYHWIVTPAQKMPSNAQRRLDSLCHIDISNGHSSRVAEGRRIC